MKLYLKSERSGYDASAEYYVKEKKFVIKKGSKISNYIACSDTFKASKKIVERRENTIDKNNITLENVTFKSPSTAANYVTGRSTNGLIAWKNENGKKLKDILNNE